MKSSDIIFQRATFPKFHAVPSPVRKSDFITSSVAGSWCELMHWDGSVGSTVSGLDVLAALLPHMKREKSEG